METLTKRTTSGGLETLRSSVGGPAPDDEGFLAEMAGVVRPEDLQLLLWWGSICEELAEEEIEPVAT